MRKIKLYIAISLNGKIASADGGVAWLDEIPNPEKTDYGYHDFYKSIDTTIMGFTTYQQVIDWGIDFPYADKKNYVLTTKTNLENTQYVEFIKEDHLDFIKKMKAEKGEDIWQIGGGLANTLLSNGGLIDEMIVHVMPIIVPKGIELFGGDPTQFQLKLKSCKSYSSGVVELRYESSR